MVNPPLADGESRPPVRPYRMLMPDGRRFGPMPSRATTWSIAAGGYAFLCGTVLLATAQPISGTLLEALGVRTRVPMVLMAAPAALLGAVVWWAVVERRGTYSYPRGAIFGALTATVTVFAWVLKFLEVWGFELVATGWFVVAFVLALTGVGGLLSGLPLMYARRRAIR